jgi:FemAB-related protein (PEP-CTERM system-associated)
VTLPFNIRLAEPEDRAAWDSYVLDHPQSTFFHRFGWRQAIENAYGHDSQYLIAEDDTGLIQGIVPLTLVKSPFFGRSLISTAFTVGGGVLASSPEAYAALAEEMVRQGHIHDVQYVEVRGGAPHGGWAVKDETYAGFTREIAQSEDECLTQIPRKKRADLRKAIKAAEAGKLTVQCSDGLGSFYALYAESVRNLGTPVMPRKFIQQLLYAFGDDVEVSVVDAEGKAVAGLISFYHRDTVLPYYGGAKPAARGLHAYDYMYWAQMRRAAEKGIKQFDFGRSKTGTGAYAYKKHWGFEPQPLTYQYYLIKAQDVPDVNPNNPKFKLMTQVWQKLPLPVANRLGPVLAGNLA